MPAQYEAIRDKFTAKGMGLAEAKTHAAKIYNSTHHSNPVTNHMSYSKGGDVHVTEYAKGGPVLGRARDFVKSPEAFRSGGAPNPNYATDKDALTKRTGDKSEKAVKPRG